VSITGASGDTGDGGDARSDLNAVNTADLGAAVVNPEPD